MFADHRIDLAHRRGDVNRRRPLVDSRGRQRRRRGHPPRQRLVLRAFGRARPAPSTPSTTPSHTPPTAAPSSWMSLRRELSQAASPSASWASSGLCPSGRPPRRPVRGYSASPTARRSARDPRATANRVARLALERRALSIVAALAAFIFVVTPISAAVWVAGATRERPPVRPGARGHEPAHTHATGSGWRPGIHPGTARPWSSVPGGGTRNGSERHAGCSPARATASCSMTPAATKPGPPRRDGAGRGSPTSRRRSTFCRAARTCAAVSARFWHLDRRRKPCSGRSPATRSRQSRVRRRNRAQPGGDPPARGRRELQAVPISGFAAIRTSLPERTSHRRSSSWSRRSRPSCPPDRDHNRGRDRANDEPRLPPRRARAKLWELPRARPYAGLKDAPAAYRRRVIRFLDAALYTWGVSAPSDRNGHLLLRRRRGSTRLARELGEGWQPVLADLRRLLREAVAAADGHSEVDSRGDELFAVVRARPRPPRRLRSRHSGGSRATPGRRRYGVRIGLHTGVAALGEDGYVGVEVHRAFRIANAGHGGQIVASRPPRSCSPRPRAPRPRPLGAAELPEPERIFQLEEPGLGGDFPRCGRARCDPCPRRPRRRLRAAPRRRGAPARRRRLRRRGAVRQRRRPAAPCRHAQAGRGGRRHPDAADADGRGPARRQGDPRAAPRGRRARALAVRRAGLRDGPPLGQRRGRRLPAQGPRAPTSTSSPPPSGASPRAARRSTRPSSAQLVGRHRARRPARTTLSPREREVLELMAEGRSNQAIAERLFVTARAVEKHVTSIFVKLRPARRRRGSPPRARRARPVARLKRPGRRPAAP